MRDECDFFCVKLKHPSFVRNIELERKYTRRVDSKIWSIAALLSECLEFACCLVFLDIRKKENSSSLARRRTTHVCYVLSCVRRVGSL